MTYTGLAVFGGSLLLAGLLFYAWVLLIAMGLGSGVAHLLLLLAVVIAPVGVFAGVLLIIAGARYDPRP